MPMPRTPHHRFAAPAAALAAVLAIGAARADDRPLLRADVPVPTALAAAALGQPATPSTVLDVEDEPSTTAPGSSTTGSSTTASSALPPTTTTTAPPSLAPPPLAPRSGGIPVGKGMWIWLPERTDGGNPQAIVDRAVAAGLTHVYVRTGSSRQGFEAAAFLEALLPVAHGAGLRVYGWDFPYLEDVAADVDRAMTAITFRTTTGHRIDGFVPDIETGAEGTNLSAETAGGYSQALRAAVGADYPLVACVPNPSPRRIETFPYAAILPHYDAVAPMVYWLNRQPDTDVAQAVTWLSQFGKPVIPVGQAYDGGPEGGRPGPPPPEEIDRFLAAAERYGATGASFWSWQHATPEIWAAIANAPQLTLPAEGPLDARQIVALQTQLRSLGYWAPPTATWDADTVRALSIFQIDRGRMPTGRFDAGTRADLVGPLAPPVG
jgi:hypothetical protein